MDLLGIGSEGDSAKELGSYLGVLLVQQVVEGLVDILQINQDTDDSIFDTVYYLRDQTVDGVLFAVLVEVAAEEILEQFIALLESEVDVVQGSLHILGNDHEVSCIVSSDLDVRVDKLVD